MSADISTKLEDCGEVDLDHLVPVIIGELGAGMTALDASTIHKNVDFVSILQNSRCESGNIFLRC